MRRLVLAGVAALALLAAPDLAQAQDKGGDAAPPDAAKAAATPPDDSAKDAQPKGRISEEGGMKASGPSQGKGGESR